MFWDTVKLSCTLRIKIYVENLENLETDQHLCTLLMSKKGSTRKFR